MKKISFLFLCITVAAAGYAQEVLSMDDILAHLRLHHPAVKSSESAARAAEARAPAAYGWPAPELGAGLFQAPYDLTRWKGSSAMPGMGMFMVSAEQMFPNKKFQEAEYQFLRSEADIQREKGRSVLRELLYQLRGAYYRLIIDEHKQALYTQNKKLLDFMIGSAEIRYRNNLGSINSYYKLKAALAKLHTAELVLLADMKQQQGLINSLMQRGEEKTFVVDTSFAWVPFDERMKDLHTLAETSNYRTLEKMIASSSLEVETEQASLKPQFGLRFEHMAGFGRQPQMFSFMAMARFPMAKWSSRASRARIESLVHEQDALRLQQSAYLNQQGAQSRALFAELQGVRHELKMYEGEIIPALQKNMQTLQISYEQNNAEIFELYDAWQSLLDARLEYLKSLQRGMDLQNELMKVFEIE